MTRTKAELKKLHRELWQWLADNPDEWKRSWPEWVCCGGKVEYAESYCFACEAAGNKDGETDCGKCPCDWKVSTCCHSGSAYMKWRAEPKLRTKYALQVRDAWK